MAGYSGTPLVKKLGYKAGFRAALINPPEDYHDLVRDLPEGVTFDPEVGDLDLVHIFCNQFEPLEEHMARFKDQIKPEGMIWISWYKKASKLPTEINEDIVRGCALSMGLVDVKVCAVDEKWSGLKVVIRKENRKK